MVNQKRIALFVDIDNMPLNKQHVDNIITQLEKSGEIVCAKIYGVTDRRHREIICDAVARGFDVIPPVYPTRRGSTKVFDIRIIADLCELVAINKTIDGVAIVANPAHQVYLFSKLKRNGIKIFACDNLDEDSAKFVDEFLYFGYDCKSKAQPKEEVSSPVVEDVAEQVEEKAEVVEQTETVEPVAETAEQVEVAEQIAEVVEEQPAVETVAQTVEETVAEETVAEVVEQQAEEQQTETPEQIVEEQVVEQEQVEPVVEEQQVEQPQQVEEVVVDVVEETQPDDNELDILKQIQQMKQDVPSADDEEDAELIEKIKQLLDEFN